MTLKHWELSRNNTVNHATKQLNLAVSNNCVSQTNFSRASVVCKVLANKPINKINAMNLKAHSINVKIATKVANHEN
jgi:hypothetical protein